MKDYKKIFEGIVDIIRTTEKSDIGFANICTYIGENCPELKESEDEKIRKWCISHFKACINVIKDNDEYKEYLSNKVISWLEKQGRHANFRNKIQIGDKVTRNEDGVLVNLSQLNRVAEKNKKQGENHDDKYNITGIKSKHAEGKLGEMIKKLKPLGEILDKQSEQKQDPCDNCKDAMLNCHNFPCIKKRAFKQGKSALEAINEEKVDNANKVEPKFKQGDWIVCNKDNTIHQIKAAFENITKGKYCYDLTNGGYIPTSKENDYHLWTIEDAKDGDVIFYDSGRTCIFKCIHGIWYSSYCFITDDGEFHTGYEEHLVNAKINGNANPATKEQRDLLFQKIKEAGYKWDADKKELRKIEKSHTNKVGPKFKVGNWIIGKATNNEPRQISEITDQCYKSTYGGQYGFSFEDELHLWTIKDAKDGDVLAVDDMIFIYKTILSSHVVSYCRLIDNVFNHFEYARTCCEGNPYIHPATKEQRDILMKAMADAGYTFDFERKELKKIKDEIEIPFGAKDSELQEVTYYIPKGFHAEIDDDKVVIKKGEKPTALSEEDKTALGDALWCCKQAASIAKNENDMGNIWYAEKWLKSLEGRIQPKNNYNPYKEVVESIAKMCERYDKYSHSILKDFFNNVKAKCKDAKEFDSLHPQNTKAISQ